MEQAPKWYLPTAIAALVWNLLGCAAYLKDVMLTPDAVAKMTAAQQALYAARPAWSVAATAIAVWGGAVGSVGLILHKRWATPVFLASLVALVLQDASLFVFSGAPRIDPVALVLQGLVLLVAIGLVMLARKAATRGWTA